jgi:uncharacterized protein YndB with AHSA1/START domain
MSKPKPQFDQTDLSKAGTDRPGGGEQSDLASFQTLEQAHRNLPRLQIPGAWTVARDRWERLVSRSVIPASPEEIWRAMTDPSALKKWLAVCHGSLEQLHCDCVLDFEDGEYFLCRSIEVTQPVRLKYLWRWLGIGQATSVTWQLDRNNGMTAVTVTEEAINPPWDWQTWNGGGWPGILDQLAGYLRTGMEWRWPWRRMGPYVQIEIPLSIYEAWDRLTSPSGLKYWLLAMQGSLAPEQSLTVLMGDASGTVDMKVREVVQPGQAAPSFLPYVTYSLNRHAWNTEIGGRLWIEPSGWGRSLLQVFHYNWENLPAGLQLSERKILTGFWAGALGRARMMCGGAAEAATAPHNW